MNRREFISLVGASASVSIAACNSQSADVASDVRSDGFEVVGSLSELDKTGQLLNEDLADGKALVIRDPANPNQAIAVNPTCPHAGCNVAWQQAEKAFVCPCHNSKFASDGSVQNGPAKEPLATYSAKFEGDLVLVKSR
ncbi:ubiquinol-cytochrome c reductase iron-sulfur subunit [Chroogloeocystis siderophila]|jgi:cytochrome b6-f complex iron-sulfur subunit|uniref:Cytochrome B6 n=1 Tax=Chroogloeocystis siderophila 5.2 s.c.1 TaxID=247279 RepID=A0A1U7HVJ1_9CHRO|nr:Rieske 2Fe-2S domain-containing protein [Chroogloeocystis siderophila]OKH27620.1 cytochrome B6 [Chroogloeocystis siderophila 5.2 s.c.1]